ncbi:DNA-binding protein H-NS [Shimia aestuarii]|uniref:DNA-binding protein H-NS n=2 Tax=Shimia aestuarii TaxID=254406 RepID=A0A1I4HWQ1_9RHOB|nr:DNA-binding protein H-NS [Shimia aestuarii]
MKLDGMSADELIALKERIDAQLLKLEAERKENALKAIREAAEKHGYTLDEIASIAGKRKGALAKGVPKYVHPQDPTTTWTGKGRKPKWFDEALAAGITPDQMEL